MRTEIIMAFPDSKVVRRIEKGVNNLSHVYAVWNKAMANMEASGTVYSSTRAGRLRAVEYINATAANTPTMKRAAAEYHSRDWGNWRVGCVMQGTSRRWHTFPRRHPNGKRQIHTERETRSFARLVKPTNQDLVYPHA